MTVMRAKTSKRVAAVALGPDAAASEQIASLEAYQGIAEELLERSRAKYQREVRRRGRLEEDLLHEDPGSMTARLDAFFQPMRRLLDDAVHLLFTLKTADARRLGGIEMMKRLVTRYTTLRDAFLQEEGRWRALAAGTASVDERAELDRVARLSSDIAHAFQQLTHLSRNQERVRQDIHRLLGGETTPEE